ncbi:MAG: ATP-binding cassette domain-containing protein [Clostridia bacterium]
MFVVDGVSKKFGDECALRDLSMTMDGGLNFIVGASGSGKTTLLRILSGMDQAYDGSVRYGERNMKNLTERERSYCYHHLFGFVWQDFHLLDDCTALENALLPQYLGARPDRQMALRILEALKIGELSGQKVGKLSGGQKQRVAIAQALMKDPEVLLADEPTSALDAQAAKAIMAILRDIARTRTVVVVTHDTSLIGASDKVYVLDKGELIHAPAQAPETPAQISQPTVPSARLPHRLSIRNAFTLSLGVARRHFGRFLITALSVLVAAALFWVPVSGVLLNSSQSAFDDLFASYGQGILDIDVVNGFSSAGDTGGAAQDAPSARVSQDIFGLYETYQNDARLSHIVFTQAFNDIRVSLLGQSHAIKTTGTVPTIRALTCGVMPMGDGREVVIPDSLVKTLGVSGEAVLGETLAFEGSVYTWDRGAPIAVPVRVTARIVGVADTTVRYKDGAQMLEYSVDDTFFFSRAALDEMLSQAKVSPRAVNFTMRAKTPADLISLKDGLNARGIVPLGRFELVEDMVRLSEQTRAQSASAVFVVAALSVLVLLSVSLMTAFSRRRECAIYALSGFSRGHIARLTASQALLAFSVATLLFLLAIALLHGAGLSFRAGQCLHCVGLIAGASAFSGLVQAAVATRINVAKLLMTGEK